MYQISIEESIKRILQTPIGSRVMLPEFGSMLHTLIDRKLDEKFKLDFYRYTAQAIKKWEKRVELERIELGEKTGDKIVYTLFFKGGDTMQGVING